MSDMAKAARAAMKDKAKRLTSDRPLEKVESSDFTPPAMLNAGAKTGMRPVSPRQYKKGGKVDGEHAKMNMGRKPRKSGGKAEMPLVDRYINRDNKKANEFRDGEKHTGGMKKGGRAKKLVGGPLVGAQNMMNQAQQTAGVPGGNTLYGLGRSGAVQKGSLSPARAVGLKKGGEAKGHPDVAEDKALIRKMVKPSARTGKADGGPNIDEDYYARAVQRGGYDDTSLGNAAAKDEAIRRKAYDEKYGTQELKKGGRTGRKTGGGVFSGPGYPGKVPGAVPGGRTAHAHGGKTKGKTDINIMVNPHHPADAAGMGMPPAGPMGGPTKPPGMGGPAGGMPMPPGGMPPGMMPPGMGGPPGGMPMAGGPPGMPPGMPPIPPGMMPKPRKSGGRTYSSFEDMDAGAGGAKARIEKTEIARKHSGIQKQNY